MSVDRELDTRIEQMIDSYVTANPMSGTTPLAHKIRALRQTADAASRLAMKYEGSIQEEPGPKSLVSSPPQH